MILLLPACRVTPATAALLALGGSAWADAPEGDAIRSVESWGTTTPAFVSLEPAEDHPADLLFVNELTLGNPLQMFFVLSINGLRVDVEVSNGAGDAPDVITVYEQKRENPGLQSGDESVPRSGDLQLGP